MDHSPSAIGVAALIMLNLLAAELAMILPPAWLMLPEIMVLLTLVTTGLLLWRRERGWGWKRRHCPACGYRARIESRVCGMCGHVFE